MQQERILVAAEDELAPVEHGELVLSSDGSAWSGLLLESHRIRAQGRLRRFSPYHDLVALCTAGHGVVEIRLGTGTRRFALEPGVASIFSRDCELESVSWSGAHAVLLVEVRDSRHARLLGQAGNGTEPVLAPRFGIRDPSMTALMVNMRSEVEDGCPLGALYGESLCLALVSYLSGRYGAARRAADAPRSKLSPSQLRAVRDYVSAHLCEDMSVAALAGVVELSPHYFSKLFRNTLGTTPHRYVLVRRVEEGRRLLASRQLSILEVAMCLGFASQSHFTDVFRRITGTTPRRYRQEH